MDYISSVQRHITSSTTAQTLKPTDLSHRTVNLPLIRRKLPRLKPILLIVHRNLHRESNASPLLLKPKHWRRKHGTYKWEDATKTNWISLLSTPWASQPNLNGTHYGSSTSKNRHVHASNQSAAIPIQCMSKEGDFIWTTDSYELQMRTLIAQQRRRIG
jgi:hypothetical protein